MRLSPLGSAGAALYSSRIARSSNALQELGRPAMARVINALHDLYGDVNANNMKLSQVTRCLQQLTGMAFAYDVRGSGDAAKDKIARESVVKQWFAWWWRYANDNYQEAIDQTEDLDSAPAKIALISMLGAPTDRFAVDVNGESSVFPWADAVSQALIACR